jgi:hypothetical protein
MITAWGREVTTSLTIATTIVSVWVEGAVIYVRRIVGAVGMKKIIRVRVLKAVLLEVGLTVGDGNGKVGKDERECRTPKGRL